MASYLLYTNHASKLLNVTHPLWDRIHAAVANGDGVVLPVPLIEEMRFGVENTANPDVRSHRLAALDRLLSSFRACP
jgi:hypothetical protein